MRTRRALSVVAVTLGLVLTACGGDGDSSSDPSPSGSPESESPSPSPTETEQAGPPKQPKGKHGVTYDIQNWDEYAEDPVVLAWKQAFEAGAASVNKGETVKAFVRASGGQARRDLLGVAQQAWANNWHHKKVAHVRIQGSRVQGNRARVRACVWAPSISMYQANGEEYREADRAWVRLDSRLRNQGENWRLMSFEESGTCKGGAPQ